MPYYVTRGTKSITHGITNYLGCTNKLLLAHRRNIKASVVETKSVSDACTMPTPYLILDESVVNQTKCWLVAMIIASLLTIKTTFSVLYTVVKLLLVGS